MSKFTFKVSYKVEVTQKVSSSELVQAGYEPTEEGLSEYLANYPADYGFVEECCNDGYEEMIRNEIVSSLECLGTAIYDSDVEIIGTQTISN